MREDANCIAAVRSEVPDSLIGEARISYPYIEARGCATIEIEEGDFVFAVRRDSGAVASALGAALSKRLGISLDLCIERVRPLYERFESRLYAVLQDSFRLGDGSRPLRSAIHLFEPSELERALASRTGGLPVVSLDPMMSGFEHELAVSRLYSLDGKRCLGIVERPGAAPLAGQIEKLRGALGSRKVRVVDDDLFTGETARQAIADLGLVVERFVPQIQAGSGAAIAAMGVRVDPVVRYVSDPGSVNIGDPRDFLLGASGLVVRLPSGKLGRAPYLLPFTSLAARASVGEELEERISIELIGLAESFYSDLSGALGADVELRDVDPGFERLVKEVHGFPSCTPMREIAMWARSDMERIRRETAELSELQNWLEISPMPARMIFLDVNGTLLAEEAASFEVDPVELDSLRSTIERLQSRGAMVGLCSDTPVEQLRQVAATLGAAGPILAENGNVIYHDGRMLILRGLQDPLRIRRTLERAVPAGYERQPDCLSPEFGGEAPDFERGDWAFGKNRRSAVTIFGPASLIDHLAAQLGAETGITVDCSPEYNFLAVHAGSDFRSAKGRTLTLLRQLGSDVSLVGNSMSDWVEPCSGVECSFVAGSRISPHVGGRARFVSQYPLMSGVIDILSRA